MPLSLSGIAYLILTFSLGFVDYRFFQYWRKQRDKVSKLLFYFIFPLILFTFIRGLVLLFFSNNPQVLINSLIAGPFLQGIAFGILLYLIVSLYLPKTSPWGPWIGFLVIFTIGIITAFLQSKGIFFGAGPVFTSLGLIDWGTKNYPRLYSLLRLIVISPLVGFFVMLFGQYRASQDQTIKRRALGLAVLLLIGGAVGVFEIALIEIPLLRDITMVLLSIIVIPLIILTQKPPA